MADRFDEMSKHMAGQHSRRGLFRVFGAGFLGAALAGAFARGADAIDPKEQGLPAWNGSMPGFNFNLPRFNQTLPRPPAWNGYIAPNWNGYIAPIWNGNANWPPHFNHTSD